MATAPFSQSSPETLVERVIALLGAISARFGALESEEWDWIRAHAPSERIVGLLREATPVSMRVLDAIGRLERANGSTVATQSHVPKGTVSKVARRLARQELITRDARPNNKKEVFFRLTPLGRELVDFHREFDALMERGFRTFLARHSADELIVLVNVLDAAVGTSFIQLGEAQAPRD